MTRFIAIAAAAFLSLAGQVLATPTQISRVPKAHPAWVKVAVTCFATGEQTSGMNKICYYNCLGSQAAITVPAVSLCPLTIDR